MAYLLELHDKITYAQNRIDECNAELEARTQECRELTALALFCGKCQKFYPKESFTISETTRTSVETVYRDAGYGDDDEIADVTRSYTYHHCPVCGEPIQVGEGKYLYSKNTRLRRG